MLQIESEEEECQGQGYISCLSNAMVQEFVYLHVRVSNHAAIKFYTKTPGYKIHDSAAKFIDDGEDGYGMKKQLQGKQQPDHHLVRHGFSHGGGCCWSEAKYNVYFSEKWFFALSFFFLIFWVSRE
ncbi:hypothetical protein MKX01_032609 [Papaver californicum]|nr:hypothetical protein MKX01_032609 [Papaver californicum]